MTLDDADGLGDLRGSRSITKTPTGHGVYLGETIDGDGEILGNLAYRSRADVLLIVVDQLLVYLIRKNDDILGLSHFDDGFEFFLGVNRTGRVVGAVENQHAGASADGVLEFFGRHLPTILALGLNEVWLGTGKSNHFRVTSPVGSRNNDFVLRVTAGENGVIAGVLGAAVHRNLADVVFQPIIQKQLLLDRFFQLRDTRGRSVFGLTIVESLNTSILDVLGGIEVRLSSAKAGNILAFVAHLFGGSCDGEGLGR